MTTGAHERRLSELFRTQSNLYERLLQLHVSLEYTAC